MCADKVRYYGGYLNPSDMLDGVCAAHRSPPLQPDVVRRLLDTEKCFTAKADIEVVDQLYRAFFDGIIKFACELDFCNLQWGSAEAKALVEVLPRFAALTSLMCARPDTATMRGNFQKPMTPLLAP